MLNTASFDLEPNKSITLFKYHVNLSVIIFLIFVFNNTNFTQYGLIKILIKSHYYDKFWQVFILVFFAPINREIPAKSRVILQILRLLFLPQSAFEHKNHTDPN